MSGVTNTGPRKWTVGYYDPNNGGLPKLRFLRKIIHVPSGTARFEREQNVVVSAGPVHSATTGYVSLDTTTLRVVTVTLVLVSRL